jgi:hypothetical protein
MAIAKNRIDLDMSVMYEYDVRLLRYVHFV